MHSYRGFRFVSLMVSCAVVLAFAVTPIAAQDCPELVGHLVGGHLSHAHDVAVSGAYAYVAGSGLFAIDVSSPSTPVEVGSFPTGTEADAAERVTVSGGYVYLASGEGGLYIFTECGGGPAPDGGVAFFPAAAYASGSEGAFFQTDIEINNKGDEDASVTLLWLPRGQDNSEPTASDPITIGPGESIQYPNVLSEVFGLTPNAVGAVAMVADSMYVIGMSRTYNIQETEVTLTFGQALPAVPYDQLIMTGDTQRITFMSENDAFRANLGCVNGTDNEITVSIDLFDSDGTRLETTSMVLPPWSNKQLNQLFEDYAPVNGYVDVWTTTPGASLTCYGSVLDNVTSDPTTILPQ